MTQFYGLNKNTNLDGSLASDYQAPSQKAVKAYIDGKISSLNYDYVVALEADETMSNLMQNQNWYNVNIVLSSNASRTITVDNMAENENYFILSNSAETPISYTFDFSSRTQYIFVGNPEYAVSNQKLIITLPALSNMLLTFRPLNDESVGFYVTRVRAAI